MFMFTSLAILVATVLLTAFATHYYPIVDKAVRKRLADSKEQRIADAKAAVRAAKLAKWRATTGTIASGGGPDRDDDLGMFFERARRGLTLEDGRFETRPAEPVRYALALAPAAGGPTLNAELRMPPADSPPRGAGRSWTSRLELAAPAVPPAAGARHEAAVVADGATLERFRCRIVSWTEPQGQPPSLVVLRTAAD